MSGSAHIGIAGGGLLGRLLAMALASRGMRVSLYDPAPSLTEAPAAYSPLRAAGWTAAGMLSPTAELECANEAVFALGLRSLRLWREIVAQLAAAGLPVDLTHAGSLLLAHRGDEGAAQRVLQLLHKKAPPAHAPQAISALELRALEPDIHGPAHAWLLPHEGHIHTVQAMAALGQWLHDHGVAHIGGPAGHVRQVGPGALWAGADPEPVRVDHVFDVRGTGAGRIPATAAHTDPGAATVRGVRGEIFWLHAPGVRLGRPVRLLHPRWRVYIVPRAGEHIVVGATEIESEDRSPVSVRSALELLSAAHSVLPALAEARILFSEANLRPALPDNLPLLHTQSGLTTLNGLFRHGWLIAPALVEQALAALPASLGLAPTGEPPAPAASSSTPVVP